MKQEVEETQKLILQYDENGLLPAIVQETQSGDILMMAYVNEDAVHKTIETGFATFWSRSRNELWKKGETSGNMMKIDEILVDCDQDCLIFKVQKTAGGACHTKNRKNVFRQSCFYRTYNFESGNLNFLEK